MKKKLSPINILEFLLYEGESYQETLLIHHGSMESAIKLVDPDAQICFEDDDEEHDFLIAFDDNEKYGRFIEYMERHEIEASPIFKIGMQESNVNIFQI